MRKPLSTKKRSTPRKPPGATLGREVVEDDREHGDAPQPVERTDVPEARAGAVAV